MAAAISNMNGVAGRTGWSWIFILEGLFTILCAIASFWVVQDFPETAKFLTVTERWYLHELFGNSIHNLSGVFVIRRLRADMRSNAGGEQFKIKYVWQSLKDWKTYIASKSCFPLSSDGSSSNDSMLVGIHMGL